MEIRDPIHGAIAVTASEANIIDHPFVQRLRNIKATGFSHLPFPGATHTRYAHSLGVMHLAGVAFDRALEAGPSLPAERRAAFRAAVRLAALCHDLGHAPFSHCTEFAMPPLSALGLDWYGEAGREARRATHEDYTIAILAHTDLAEVIQANAPVTARHVAALVSIDVSVDDGFFEVNGLNWRPFLSQLISSELDVDRLDYLVRDSYYTGARYGQVDVTWLISNLSAVAQDSDVTLGLDPSAIYAFDDFMIARHHMFLMVYFHHKSVVYEEILKRHVTSPGCPWSLPAELDAYLYIDDIWLEHQIRSAKDEWARRLVERRLYRRVVERHGSPQEVDLNDQASALRGAGIDCILSGSTGKLSRYNVIGQKRERARAIAVASREQDLGAPGVRTIAEASQVFARYADARRIARLYVPPERLEDARKVLGLGGE
jgi:HD superfamily phosphohydrolase